MRSKAALSVDEIFSEMRSVSSPGTGWRDLRGLGLIVSHCGALRRTFQSKTVWIGENLPQGVPRRPNPTDLKGNQTLGEQAWRSVARAAGGVVNRNADSVDLVHPALALLHCWIVQGICSLGNGTLGAIAWATAS
jgi:hypothetical protein